MVHALSLESAEAFRTAFRVQPEIAEEVARERGLGLYGWCTPDMDGFELPSSDELVVALHLGGSRRVRSLDGHSPSRAVSSPGLLTLLPPGRPAAFRTEGSVRLVSLHVPSEMTRALGVGHLAGHLRNPSLQFAFRDPFVSAGLEALHAAARSGRPVRPDYFLRVADGLLCHLAQRASDTLAPTPPPADGATARIGRIAVSDLLEHIETCLAEPLHLDDLALRTGLRRAAFARQFRDAVGAPPHQYLGTRRVEKAKRLLRETGMDLAHIAQDTGYSSQSHFTAVFHAAAGCTPARYRAGSVG